MLPVLNGVELGELPASPGGDGKFTERVGLALTADAIRSLGRRNELILRNPNHDYYSARRFWIELELADGRKCSSAVSTATYTQPMEWPHAEGIRIPFDRDLRVEIWFPLAR
jgi:hypothetical protein